MWTLQAINHLSCCHQITRNGDLFDNSTPSSRSQSQTLSKHASVLEQLKQGTKRKRPLQLTVDKARLAILQWIISRRLPLNILKDDDFIKMILTINKDLVDYISPTAKTVKNWILAEF